MSSPTIEELEIDDDLKALGVINFKKQDQTILVLWKSKKDNNKNTAALIFPSSNDGPYDTLLNFENSCKGKLDRKIVEEIKVVLSQNNKYLQFLIYADANCEVNGNGNDTAVGRGEDAQRALELAEEQCSELFLDQFGSPYSAVKIDKHVETLPLKSSRFKNWLCKAFYESEGDVLNSENVNAALNILKAKAEFGGIVKELHLRVVRVQESPYTIYYDLTNKDWQVIKVTEDNWSIEYAPTMFRRYSNQLPQLYPSKEYPSDVFDKFMGLINVGKNEDNKLLFKCYIIALFYPDIPKPILMLHGEQGSAKSTLEELIKMLVDPSSIKTVTFPRSIAELVQKLMHNYVCYFDNVSVIPGWVSDQLCRAVTGSGFSKRELWTDDDDIIYFFKRCIGFNGINLAATKADLLDRGIIEELERIPKEKRQKIEEIWQEFKKIKPQLLGYILDILVKVLQVKKNGGIEIKGYPRMADFAEIGEIISRCIGNEDNKFLDAYYRNIDLQVEEAIEAHPVARAIVKFIEDKQEWKGTATELLAELEKIAPELKINTHEKLWPKAPNSLSRRITQVKTNLREIGIIIEKDSSDNSNKLLLIQKVSKNKENGKISTESPERGNQVQNMLESSVDINETTEDISHYNNKISPENQPQNQAQSNSSVGIIDIGDIIPISTKPNPDNITTTINNEDKIKKQNIENICRIGHTDNFACKNCKMTGDRFFMEVHECSGAS